MTTRNGVVLQDAKMASHEGLAQASLVAAPRVRATGVGDHVHLYIWQKREETFKGFVPSLNVLNAKRDGRMVLYGRAGLGLARSGLAGQGKK